MAKTDFARMMVLDSQHTQALPVLFRHRAATNERRAVTGAR